MIIQVRVVLGRTGVDIGRHFNNLCGSQLQSLSEMYHVS